ncbi:MAG: hypothetical protein U1D69_07130 [Polynucleobacter sp.]|uniref:hypothetical protein n=1 Tax=Limnobacter sp. TaxID=2003368 RepID=UPI002735E321|nr:hypothetical protein [Limnobacter sp.]MDP3272918.1 hypothetical protein [Limnobacter sp.]MDZ4056729.1 hypothetical protein [Polynucleobacter sp.]
MLTDYSTLTDYQKDILAQCRYGYWLTNFQHKFYQRANAVANFLQILLGGAVVATVIQQSPFATLFGFIVATIGALQLVVPFGQYAERADKASQRFHDFENKFAKMPEADAFEKLSDLQSFGVSPWNGMEILAHNVVCDLHKSPEEKQKETLSSKFFKLFI